MAMSTKYFLFASLSTSQTLAFSAQVLASFCPVFLADSAIFKAPLRQHRAKDGYHVSSVCPTTTTCPRSTSVSEACCITNIFQILGATPVLFATFNQLWMTLISFHMISRRLAFCFFPHSTLCFGTVCAFQYFPLRSTCNSCCRPNSCRKALFFCVHASPIACAACLAFHPWCLSLFQLHDVVFCPLLQVSDFYMLRWPILWCLLGTYLSF